MATRESILNLKIIAQNEATAAFQSLEETLKGVEGVIRDLSKEFSDLMEPVSEIGKDFVQAGEGVTEGARAMTDAQESINSLSRTTGELDDVIYSIRELGFVMNDVVGEIQLQTHEVVTAFEDMATQITEANSESRDSIDSVGQLIGLQMLGNAVKDVGDKGAHMWEGAIGSSAEFEYNMSRIHAVLMNRDPQVNMQEMASTALKLGMNSKFSALEISEAMYDLSRQGLTSVQILGDGVNGTIEIVNDLAQATDTDMKQTATVITDVMHEFNLSAQQTRTVANVISGALHNSSESMTQFYYSMRQVGPVASSMHQSVNDVSTALAILAQHGIVGSQAGTTLKNMLLGLEPHTKQAAALMKDLGISAKQGAADSFYQLDGTLKPMPQILDILNQKFGGLKDAQKEAALSTIFTKYGLAGLNVVVTQNRQSFEAFQKQLMQEDAADIAHEKMNNLQGDMWRFHAALQTLAKSFGDTLGPALRGIVQEGTKVLNWLNGLSPTTKKVIMIILGLGSVLAIAAGSIITFGVAMSFMAPGLELLGTVVGGLFAPFGLLTRGVGGLGRMFLGTGGAIRGFGGALRGVGEVASMVVLGPWKMLDKFLVNFDFKFTALRGFLAGPFLSVFKGLPKSIGSIFGLLGGGFTKFFGLILSIGPRILAGVRMAFSFEGILTAVRVAFAALTGPIGILVFVITAAVGAIIANWDKIKKWCTEHFGHSIPETWNKLSALAKKNFETIRKIFETVWNNVKKVTEQVWAYIKPTIISAIQAIAKYWNEIWPELKEVFIAVWKIMKVILTPIIAVIVFIIGTALGFIKGIWKDVWGVIVSVFKLVWDIIVGVLKFVWHLISGLFKIFLDLITGHWKKAWNDLVQMLKNVWNDIWSFLGNVIKDAWNFGKNFVMMIVHGIEGAIHFVVDAVKKVASKIKSFLGFHSPAKEGPGAEADQWAPNFVNMYTKGLNDGIPKVQDAVTSLVKPLEEGMKKAIDTVANTMRSGFNSIAQQARMMAQAVIAAVQQATAAMKSMPSASSVSTGSVGKLPHFATGGVVDKPTLAVVGEQEREYIVPQSKLKEFVNLHAGINMGAPASGNQRPSAVNIIVNVNGSGKNGKELGNDIGKAIRQHMSYAF